MGNWSRWNLKVKTKCITSFHLQFMHLWNNDHYIGHAEMLPYSIKKLFITSNYNCKQQVKKNYPMFSNIKHVPAILSLSFHLASYSKQKSKPCLRVAINILPGVFNIYTWCTCCFHFSSRRQNELAVKNSGVSTYLSTCVQAFDHVFDGGIREWQL